MWNTEDDDVGYMLAVVTEIAFETNTGWLSSVVPFNDLVKQTLLNIYNACK